MINKDIILAFIIITIGIVAVIHKYTDNHRILQTTEGRIIHVIHTEDKKIFYRDGNCPKCD